MPIPPACAIAMAIFDSVTVSMFAETIGKSKIILREKLERKETSLRENTKDLRGTNKTSSKVKYSFIKNTPCGGFLYPLLSISKIQLCKTAQMEAENGKNFLGIFLEALNFFC